MQPQSSEASFAKNKHLQKKCDETVGLLADIVCSRWQESEVAPTKTHTMSIDAAAAAAVALLLPLLMLAPVCLSIRRSSSCLLFFFFFFFFISLNPVI
jgi:hypothetical protein